MAIQAGLVAPVMDGLPPRVAERETPVNALGRFDFEDERLVITQFPPPDDRFVLRRGTHCGPVDRRQKPVSWRCPAELEKELQIVVNEVSERDELSRHREVRIHSVVLRLNWASQPF